MYNIDLSFYKLKDEAEQVDSLQTKYNQAFKHKVATAICPELFSLNISDCEHCGHQITAETDSRDIIEVICNGLLGNTFCEIADTNMNIEKNDLVLIKSDDSIDIAVVDENGEIVKARRKRLGLVGENLPVVLRKVTESDLQIYSRNQEDEFRAKPVFREKIEKFSLEMKLVDVHFQFDRKKLFFFYTSDGRVDFRELAKDLAAVFKTRIELRQIGVRDEAKRIGGLGSCGREYCCATFLTNFKKISTHIVNEQNCSANLSKLSGPCGKLKCCLYFEIEEN